MAKEKKISLMIVFVRNNTIKITYILQGPPNTIFFGNALKKVLYILINFFFYLKV